MVWDWNYAWKILPELLKGLAVTIQVTLLAFLIAAILGLIFALARRSDILWISVSIAALVEFIRDTPLLVQLFLFFFILPQYGIRLPAYVVGVFALGLHYATYTSEVYRAGIDAIERGQWEAATALNFSASHTWIGIILPQAVPPMIPALGNYLIGMFKDSAQLAAITVTELLLRARSIGSHDFRFLEPITLVGILFFLISYPSALILNKLEARFGQRH
jgi:polar amino acid transport system permease protein